MTLFRTLGLVALTSAALACSTKKEGTTFPSLDTWQGTMKLELLSGEKAGVITIAKRGDVARFEAPEHPEVFGTYGGTGPRRFFYDAKAQTLTLVVDDSKQALDYDLTVLAGMAPKEQSKDFELKDTGRQDTVAGYPCQVWTGQSAEGVPPLGGIHVEVCMVQQSAKLLTLGAAFVPPGAGWAAPLLDGQHVPLSVIVKEGERTAWKARLTSIDTQPPTGAFEVPAGFQRDNFIDALKRVRQGQGH